MRGKERDERGVLQMRVEKEETEATKVVGGGNHSLSHRDDAGGHVEGGGGGDRTGKIHLLEINVQGNKVDDLKCCSLHKSKR